MNHAPQRSAHLVRLAAVAAAALLAACADPASPASPLAPNAAPSLAAGTTNVSYDSKDDAEYAAKWANIYGPGELAVGGTRTVSIGKGVTVSAVPFDIGRLQRLRPPQVHRASARSTFAVPAVGSLEFSVEMTASTPGTQAGRVIHGCYGPPVNSAVGDSVRAAVRQVARRDSRPASC